MEKALIPNPDCVKAQEALFEERNSTEIRMLLTPPAQYISRHSYVWKHTVPQARFLTACGTAWFYLLQLAQKTKASLLSFSI